MLKSGRIVFSIFSTLLVLGATLLLFLSILTGGVEKSILKKFYWLQTDCGQYPGAPFDGQCRWTNYGLCAVENDHNVNCTDSVAAFPLAPKRNFNSDEGLPSAFIDNSNYYYYTSRIGYGFSLVGLAFLVFSWIPLFVLFFSNKSLNIVRPVFWSTYTTSLLFIITAVCLSTASYVKGRNVFRNDGADSHVGVKSFAVSWACVACLLFAIPFIVLAGQELTASFFPTRRNADGTSGRFSRHNRNYRTTGWFKRNDIAPREQIIQDSNATGYDSQFSPNVASTADTAVAGNSDVHFVKVTPQPEVAGPATAVGNHPADEDLYGPKQ